LAPATLEAVSVVFITTPEMLSAADVDLLERFVTVRGGSLIVLTDRPPAGQALRLMPRVVGERREAEPQAAGLLRASEWLTFEASRGLTSIASIGQQPVVVSRAIGRGRVIVSGALDAWRFRQANDGFDTFWTSLAWDASVVAGPPLRVDTDHIVARTGTEVQVAVELQTMSATAPQGSTLEVVASGHIQCDGERKILRLWPGARPGTFSGTLRVDQEGDCTVTATVAGVTNHALVTIRDDLSGIAASTRRLESIAAAYGAPFVTPDTDDELVARVREQQTGRREVVDQRPMRSPYWLVPFVLCLAGEWWLRRRSGLS
jgi:hypothetical protein